MKTLLERAKPELKKAIAEFGVDYPNSAEHLEMQLSNNYHVSYLIYGTVLDLRSVVNRAKLEFDINHPWDWFED